MVDELRNKYDNVDKLRETFIVVKYYEYLNEQQLNSEYWCCTFL
jgi:hypothetical protein